MSAKAVLFLFAKGDMTNSNPANTAFLRAGDLADRATFYRHDLAYAERPELPKNPHNLVTSVSVAGWTDIALGAHRQIAVFFASGGRQIIHPEPARFFEVPVRLPLPEELNFIP